MWQKTRSGGRRAVDEDESTPKIAERALIDAAFYNAAIGGQLAASHASHAQRGRGRKV
jgi:hypothetical protein